MGLENGLNTRLKWAEHSFNSFLKAWEEKLRAQLKEGKKGNNKKKLQANTGENPNFNGNHPNPPQIDLNQRAQKQNSKKVKNQILL